MTPPRSKQDSANDDVITDIRLQVGTLQSDLKYLKQGQQEQGKKLDVLVENSQRFATEAQMENKFIAQDKKFETLLNGKVDVADYKLVKGVLVILGTAALLYLANVALPRLFS